MKEKTMIYVSLAILFALTLLSVILDTYAGTKYLGNAKFQFFPHAPMFALFWFVVFNCRRLLIKKELKQEMRRYRLGKASISKEKLLLYYLVLSPIVILLIVLTQ